MNAAILDLEFAQIGLAMTVTKIVCLGAEMSGTAKTARSIKFYFSFCTRRF